jgi:predicted peptidase
MKKTLLLSVACALVSSASAKVTLKGLSSENAVFPHDVSVPVSGTANDGETVTVTFDGQTETTVAKDGKWIVHLKPHKSGGPYTMTIAGENTITVNNVLVGIKPEVVPDLFEARTFKGSMDLPYRLLKPKDLDPNKKYPLVVFFHGAGERGNNNLSQLKHAVKGFADDEIRTEYPCFVIVPQCPASPAQWVDTPWSLPEHTMPQNPSKPMAAAFDLIDAIRNEFPIDSTRIYVTGISMGGFGTWDALQRHPEIFAAGVPVCGGGDKALAPSISTIPLWVIHGGADRTVLTKRSQDMVGALKAVGGQPRYDEYPGVGHNCWDRAYAQKELYDWLFAQHRPDPAPMIHGPASSQASDGSTTTGSQ